MCKNLKSAIFAGISQFERDLISQRTIEGLNAAQWRLYDDAMNGFARAIFFGKHGEFRKRELQDQLQRASALNILINAISIWNTTYLQKAIDHLKQNDAFDESLLKHISPLGWDISIYLANIILMSKIFLNRMNLDH